MNTPAPTYTSLSCPRCGAPLPQLAEQVTCPYCQARLVLRNRQDTPPPPAIQPAGAVTLASFTFPDPLSGMPAVHMQIPQGWAPMGGVTWQNTIGSPALIHFRVANPRGLEAIEAFPIYTYIWSNAPNARMMPEGGNYYGTEFYRPLDTRQALQTLFLPRYRAIPDLKILAIDSAPDIQQKLLQEPLNAGGQISGDAIRAWLEYSIGGSLVREVFVGAVLAFPARAMGPFGVTETVSWTTGPMFALRAAKDQF